MPRDVRKSLVPQSFRRAKGALQWRVYETLCPLTRAASRTVSRAALSVSVHISRDHQFVYVDNAKVASTSFKDGLVRFASGVDEVHGPHGSARKLFAQLVDLPTLRPLTWLIAHDYRFVTFVRNPYDRIASAYRFLPRDLPETVRSKLGLDPETMTFGDFVRAVCAQDDAVANIHWRSQSAQIVFGVIPYALIGRLETMDRDWFRAYEVMRVPDELVPAPVQLNRSQGSPTEWTDELRALVAERYEDDFRNFGYDR